MRKPKANRATTSLPQNDAARAYIEALMEEEYRQMEEEYRQMAEEDHRLAEEALPSTSEMLQRHMQRMKR